MKSRLAIAMVLASISASAGAQERQKLEFFAGAGLGLPLAPEGFKDVWKEGYGVGGGASYRFNSRISILGRVDYDRFAFDAQGLRDQVDLVLTPYDFLIPDFEVSVEGGETSILSFAGEVKVSLIGDEHKVSPYVTGGGGVARLSVADATLSISSSGFDPRFFGSPDTIEGVSETAPLIVFGGGTDMRLSERIALFVEARYQRLFTEDESTDHASVRGGIRIGF